MSSLRHINALALAYLFCFAPIAFLVIQGSISWLLVTLALTWIPAGMALWGWIVLPRLFD
jgi:hypothetical protein